MIEQTDIQSASGRRRRTRLLALVASVATALIIWVISVPVAGVNLIAPSGGPGSTETEEVSVIAVFAMSLLAPLAGWALLSILERFVSRARMIWTVIAIIVLLVSYGAPLGAPGLNAGSRITLFLMHTAVGLSIIPAFARSSGER